MKHLGVLKPERLVALLNWIGWPAILIYAYSMLLFPWIDGGGDWGYVQDVWDRWQTLNAAMLALISSITAFNISKFNATQQGERDFLAAKAFLPEALSELIAYFKESASVFKEGWEAGENTRELTLPILPESYKEVFTQCIRHASLDIGNYLSRILVGLQIHDARLRQYVNPETGMIVVRMNLISYLYRLAELQAMVNNLFEFARNVEKFVDKPLEWEDFRNAYGNLDIWVEEIHIDDVMNLEAFTKRAIERNKHESP